MFVDIPVDNEDLLAFICPFLIENNKTDEVISKVSKRMRNFLSELNTTYIKTNDFKNGIPFLDHLHEPNEYHLGYSGSNKGKAVSKSKAKDIFQFLRSKPIHPEVFGRIVVAQLENRGDGPEDRAVRGPESGPMRRIFPEWTSPRHRQIDPGRQSGKRLSRDHEDRGGSPDSAD